MTNQDIIGISPAPECALYLGNSASASDPTWVWKKILNSASIISAAVQKNDGTCIGIGLGGTLFYHPNNGPSPWTQIPNSGNVIAIAKNSDGLLLGIGQDHRVYVWNSQYWVIAPNFMKPLIGITILPSGMMVGIGLDNRICWFNDLNVNSFISGGDGGLLKSVTALEDGSILGVGMEGGLWKMPTLNTSWQQIPNSGRVVSIAAVPTGIQLGTWRTNNDVNAEFVKVINNASASVAFSLQWYGGQGTRTPHLASSLGTSSFQRSDTPATSASLYYTPPAEGTSCWVRAYVESGVTHDSGRNFNYVKNGQTVTYHLSGSVDFPSFD